MTIKKQKTNKLPKLPSLLERKISKTGQTRGADDDVIFQNRVARNSTVLIPYSSWLDTPQMPAGGFEHGFIVLVPPGISESELQANNLVLGENCLYFYETRRQWEDFNPETSGLDIATSRERPLLGHYVARVPATTAAQGGEKINRGFTETRCKGAGIRFFEYASDQTIKDTRLQLETLFWHCRDAVDAVEQMGMSRSDANIRKEAIIEQCNAANLLNYDRLIEVRILNKDRFTVCPLCLEELSGMGFMSRLAQAAGREVPDLTVTEVNLFHIEELRAGVYNHRPYNLGWGHHHCNIVAKDAGITATLTWLQQVVRRNIDAGFEIPE